MQTKRITLRESEQIRYFADMLILRAYHLLGIKWTKYVRWYRDPVTLDFVFEYE